LGKEISMTTKRRKRHNPVQIVRKLRDEDAMLNSGKELAVVLQTLEVSESHSVWHRKSNFQRVVSRVDIHCRRGRRRRIDFL